MNRWAVFGIVILAAFLGWNAGLKNGLKNGEAEREAIIADLPEERAYWQSLEAGLVEPTGRDLICEQIFELVRKELDEEYRFEAEAMHELYEQMDRQRD